MDNPALEVNEQRVCLFCGTRMYGHTCSACGNYAQSALSIGEVAINYEIPIDAVWNSPQQHYDLDNYGFVEIDRDDEYDPLASIPAGETLSQLLLRQLEALITPG